MCSFTVDMTDAIDVDHTKRQLTEMVEHIDYEYSVPTYFGSRELARV